MFLLKLAITDYFTPTITQHSQKLKRITKEENISVMIRLLVYVTVLVTSAAKFM